MPNRTARDTLAVFAALIEREQSIDELCALIDRKRGAVFRILEEIDSVARSCGLWRLCRPPIGRSPEFVSKKYRVQRIVSET